MHQVQGLKRGVLLEHGYYSVVNLSLFQIADIKVQLLKPLVPGILALLQGHQHIYEILELNATFLQTQALDRHLLEKLRQEKAIAILEADG